VAVPCSPRPPRRRGATRGGLGVRVPFLPPLLSGARGAEPETTDMLTAVNLHKTYRKYADVVPVLRGLDLRVLPGEFLSIVGMSGSGKSTLLHLLGTLDRPDEGEVLLDDTRIDNLPADQRDRLRNKTFGFIFQFYHLLPELTALENVLMPQMINHSVFGWWSRRRA